MLSRLILGNEMDTGERGWGVKTEGAPTNGTPSAGR